MKTYMKRNFAIIDPPHKKIHDLMSCLILPNKVPCILLSFFVPDSVDSMKCKCIDH